MQVVVQASSPRFARWTDRLQIFAQFAVLQSITWPEGSSTDTALPRVQHATKVQTSSNPSLENVPGGLAHKSVSVVKGKQVVEVCAPACIARRPMNKAVRIPLGCCILTLNLTGPDCLEGIRLRMGSLGLRRTVATSSRVKGRRNLLVCVFKLFIRPFNVIYTMSHIAIITCSEGLTTYLPT